MPIYINSKKIIKFLSCIAILLIIIHIIILFIYFTVGDEDKFDYVRMFDLDMERNVPTLFSSLLMSISALLFYILGKIEQIQKTKEAIFWFGLSLVFIFLAFDESCKIHEQLGDFTENFVSATGYLYYPWVLSYGVLVLILGLFYIRFFWRMPRKVFISFMLSAGLFLSGAIGFEILGANESSLHSTDTILYCIYYTIEETLEMFAVIYLIHILLSLLQKEKAGVYLSSSEDI
jgi:hypothetical protein